VRLVADYMGMRWGGELLAYGNRPGEVLAAPDVAVRARDLFAGVGQSEAVLF
jgi:hypothetical protein